MFWKFVNLCTIFSLKIDVKSPNFCASISEGCNQICEYYISGIYERVQDTIYSQIEGLGGPGFMPQRNYNF